MCVCEVNCHRLIASDVTGYITLLVAQMCKRKEFSGYPHLLPKVEAYQA